MIDYQPLYRLLNKANAQRWVSQLPTQIKQAFQHGDLARWQHAIGQLPNNLHDIDCDFSNSVVRIGQKQQLIMPSAQLQAILLELHPWRKGPYAVFGITIDAEWRSDWKWLRLQDHISPLKQRLVLDVGCGNGYHCWRMLGAGARTVVGIDPNLLNVMQFHALQWLTGSSNIFVLPLEIADVPYGLKAFDTVFSMGVLYHRRSPIEHLLALRNSLRSGGELVLETLIIAGKAGDTLMPQQRYAKMRNVWFIPSCATLLTWMQRCGFNNIRLVDATTTTTQEQRSTKWMRFHSLANFLDAENSTLTVEGLPAPCRALVLANAP